MFTPLAQLIKTLPRRSKTPEAILALHIRQAFGQSLKTVCADFGQEILSKVKASTYKNGALTVVCPQLVSAELSMRSGGLISDVNKQLGRKIVLRLRFRSG